VDTIVLAPGTGYQRTIDPDATPDDNQDGDLDVLTNVGGPVALQGGAIPATLATIFGGTEDRVIDQLGNTPLSMTGVRITDGLVDDPLEPGGGIRSNGSLTLVDSIVADNKSAQAAGGGISSLGSLVLEDSIIAENTAGGSGGGASVAGTLNVEGSTIGSNQAGVEPGASAEKGGGVRATGDSVTISDSTFDQNTVVGTNAVGGGLALVLSSAGNKIISGSTFTGNDAGQQGGGIEAHLNSDTAAFTVADSLIEGNSAGPGPEPSVAGGGIHLGQADLNLVRSVLRSNDATDESPSGGGLDISDDGSAIIDDSVIADNHAVATANSARGGGIKTDSSLLIRRTTIASNTVDGVSGPDRGAGLYAGPSSAGVNAYNLTVHGNLALDAGARGGGIHVEGAGSFVTLSSSTVASNFAGGPAEAGDALSENPAGSQLFARNSIVDGPSTAQVCDDTISSGGHNIATGTSCGLAGVEDVQSATPMLEPLAPNGGLVVGPPGDTEVVETRSLQVGSPSINHVPPADGTTFTCSGQTLAQLATDARGFPRPTGSGCEAGAYELTKCFGAVVGSSAIVGTEGDDVLAGTGAADLIFSLAGKDTAKGMGGADRICTSGGTDKLRGGDGPDKLDGGKAEDDCKGGAGVDKAKACEQKSSIP
jgi:hypothetical protein